MTTSTSLQPLSIPRQAGIYVRRAREAQGLTRRQLAHACGISERLLASLELGDAPGIGLDRLLAVFSALGLTLQVAGCPQEKEPARPGNSMSLPTRIESARRKQPSRAQIASPEQPMTYKTYAEAYRDFLQRGFGLEPAPRTLLPF